MLRPYAAKTQFIRRPNLHRTCHCLRGTAKTPVVWRKLSARALRPPLFRLLGRLLAGERPLNIPTTIQPANDCVGPDLQPTCPITNAGRNTVPGDNPSPGMVDTSLVFGSPKTVCLAPGLSRVASDEHQTLGTKPHIGKEPIKCSPFRHTFAGLYPQISPSPLGAQPSSS